MTEHVHVAGYACPVGGYVKPRMFWLGADDRIPSWSEQVAMCEDGAR